jgi:hypothetical protein
MSTIFDVKPTACALSSRINFEQHQRCNDVDHLIRQLGFPSDSSLSDDLAHGHIPTHLTPADVALNRRHRGPCPHQIAGKAREPPAPTSHSEPAANVGDNVVFDIQILLGPPFGGHTHEIIFVDEFSGHAGSELILSKSTADVFSGIERYVNRVFLANGHKVKHLHGDNENINRSLLDGLSKLSISISLSLPGRHARLVERYIETMRDRATSTLSPLPYHLPLKYTPLLHKSCLFAMSHSINARSSPQIEK